MIATIQGAPSISEIRMLSTIALPCLPYADSVAFPPIPHRTFITRALVDGSWLDACAIEAAEPANGATPGGAADL